MNRFLKTTILLALAGTFSTGALAASGKPTVVLVHGAFADASSWNGVISILERDGFKVVAVANPLRSVKTDGDYVARIVESIKTPVVLVGHSYGGSVISASGAAAKNVKSLVYVAAFAPEVGESAADLSDRFPGGTLKPTLAEPVALAGGDKDMSIRKDRFHEQFAADIAAPVADLMAATQRPITLSALTEPAPGAAWRTIPSFFIYGEKDKNIPAQAHAFMADRAHSKDTVAVKDASHVVMISHANKVAKVIEEAAK
ncbi:alpha/beta fold hydrolase [Rhizobium sp. WYJ-E13]|uniref:alpha/beta fold hydrolase n=1 Tax=Rhizobium sp. WYJ-E13 TaxID=2849093 RepID=UPI001C1E998F|nr:alpha/beta hydrolase [Rhizobium sp. WYJ-E13]QWW72454.1 alpha/beta hydrolase [Rhizobium sp. WYJ-E13]